MPERVPGPDRFLVRARGGPTGWQPFAPVPADIDVDMQALLVEAPELLNQGAGGPFYRAVMPSSAERVLVAVEESGRLAIVACPDEKAQDNYQRLVADVLWTGAMLWRRPYADLAAEFKKSVGAELELVVGDRAGSNWTGEQFQNGARTSLSQGRFPVIFATCGPRSVPADVVSYLKSMNIQARTVGCTASRSGEVELIMLGRTEPAPVQRETWVEPAAPRPEPAKVETAAGPTGPQTEPAQEPAEPPSGDFAWARAGTKPGVMADKRPPADGGKHKPDGRTGGKK